MAFAYMGILGVPPLFGVIANAVNVALLPIYLLVILAVMVVMHEKLNKVTGVSDGTLLYETVLLIWKANLKKSVFYGVSNNPIAGGR